MTGPGTTQPKMRIAATGVSGDIGMGVIAGLEVARGEVFILGLDSSVDCAGFHLVDAHETLPLVREPGYVDALIGALNAHHIDLLFVGVDAEVTRASAYKAQVENETAATVVAVERPWTDVFTDKIRTVEFLEEHGLPALKTYSADAPLEEIGANIDFPMIVKPRSGHGSIGIDVVRDKEELRQALRSRTDLDCVQRYVEGPEFTVGILYDRNSVLADYIVCSRELRNGRTVKCTLVHDPTIDALTERFADVAPLFGAINLQLRKDASGTPYIFEINARLSGSTEMRVALGFNDPLRLARHLLRDEKIQRAVVKEATVYRAWRNVVVPNADRGRS